MKWLTDIFSINEAYVANPSVAVRGRGNGYPHITNDGEKWLADIFANERPDVNFLGPIPATNVFAVRIMHALH